MNDKNTKDDDVSKEETDDQKENKNLNMLKKYASIAWAELGSIFTDIKNASQKIAEEKDATKEIAAVEGLHSQEKSSASEFFKKQIIDLKKFWNYMNKKSKIFIIITGSFVLFNCTPDFGPAENFLIGKCTYEKDLYNVNLKSCNPNKAIDALDSKNDYVAFYEWNEKNVWTFVRAKNSSFNLNGNASVKYNLISANKLEAEVNINGCITLSEYKRSGSSIFETPLTLVGTRCTDAQVRVFQDDQDRAPIKHKILER
jgi:hypothetical protein